MVKSIILDNNIHKLLLDKQTEMREKYKVRMNISDVAAIAIQGGISKVNLPIKPYKQQQLDELRKIDGRQLVEA